MQPTPGSLGLATLTNGFLVSSIAKSRGEMNWPDIQYIVSELTVNKAMLMLLSESRNIKESVLKQYFGPVDGKDGFVISILAVRPKQRGEVKLVSSNPIDYPTVDPKYLSNQQDMDVLMEGCFFNFGFNSELMKYSLILSFLFCIKSM